LTKLAEECSEVIQDALKTQQFGFGEVKDGLPEHMTNQHRLAMEVADLLSILEIMRLEEMDLTYLFTPEWLKAKQTKMDKYYTISHKLGMVEERFK
jgi:hypothetical protein